MIEIPEDKKVWVLTGEGAEITGYNAEYLQKMGRKLLRMPEEERRIRVRYRARRYEFWLPDLLRYKDEVENRGYGPQNSPDE